jgi:hypothetical protein
LGIEQSELLMKTFEDFENDPIPFQFSNHIEEYISTKAMLYEKYRKTRIKNCIEVNFAA